MHLRFVGDPYRKSLLKDLNASSQSEEALLKRVGAFMEAVMPPGSYPEAKVPHAISLSSKGVQVKDPIASNPEEGNLKKAIESYDKGALRRCVKEGGHLNRRFENGDFPIEEAIAKSQRDPDLAYDFIKEMIRLGATLHNREFTGRIGYIHSSLETSFIMRLLQIEEADSRDEQITRRIQLNSRWGRVHPATHIQYPWSLELELLLKEASPAVWDSGLLFLLICKHKPSLLKLALQLGANPSKTFPNSTTALMLLSQFGEAEDVELLLKTEKTAINERYVTGSPSASEGQTALHLAATTGDVKKVRLLLEHGADPLIAAASGARPVDVLGSGSDFQELDEGQQERARKELLELFAEHGSHPVPPVVKFPVQHRGTAAIIIETDSAGKKTVILGRKRNEIGGVTDELFFPGGFQSIEDDLPEKAMAREVKEEILLPLDELIETGKAKVQELHHYDKPGVSGDCHYSTRFYLVELEAGTRQELLFAEDDFVTVSRYPLSDLKVDKSGRIRRYEIAGQSLIPSNGVALDLISHPELSSELERHLRLELEGEQMLLKAAEDGDLAAVIECLESGVKPQSIDEGVQSSAIHLAADKGHLDIVNELLDRGAELREGYLVPPALEDRRVYEKVRKVSSFFFPSSPEEKEAFSADAILALSAAAMNGHTKVVERLLKAIKGTKNETRHRFLAALAAAAEGHEKICLQLCPETHLEEAFYAAATGGQTELAQKLYEKAERLYRKGKTAISMDSKVLCMALALAAVGAHQGTCEALLKKLDPQERQAALNAMVKFSFESLYKPYKVSNELKERQKSFLTWLMPQRPHIDINGALRGNLYLASTPPVYQLIDSLGAAKKGIDAELRELFLCGKLHLSQVYGDLNDPIARCIFRTKIEEKVGAVPDLVVTKDEKGAKTVHVTFKDKKDAECLEKITGATLREKDGVNYVRLGPNRAQRFFGGSRGRSLIEALEFDT